MLRSMTGFGAVQQSVEGVEYAVDIRSVNNRYVKFTIKLPEAWSQLEPEIEKFLRGRISRGSVTIVVRMRIPDEQAAYSVNTAALERYVDQLKSLELSADPMFRVDLASLLQLPGVCRPPETDELCAATREGLMDLIAKALEQLMEMRRSEGDALRADLLGQCDVVEEKLVVIGARAGNVVKDYHERLAARVEELVGAGRIQIDADVLAREIAIYAERCDIAEEMSRLTGHLDQFRQATESSAPVGRKLDFIAQEMLREANTIASKANDTEIGRAVVDIKTAVDRIKEQAANAE